MLKLTGQFFGKIRHGKQQKTFKHFLTTKPHQDHMIKPGHHDYRILHPHITKTDIKTSVENSEAITLWNTSRHGIVLNEAQQNVQVRPAAKQQNFSYHANETLYQWLSIMRGLQRLKPRYIKRKFQSDAKHVEFTREAFHLLKVQQMAKGNTSPNPRGDLEEGVEKCSAVFYPRKVLSGGKGGAFKVSSLIIPVAGSKRQMNHMAINRIRQVVRDEIPRKQVLPIRFAQEISKMKNGTGAAAERKEKFHQTCVEYRAHLFK